jgi:3-oxoacyl-[acyl-carrier protein] reductase
MEIDLRGKRALVTGGSGGLGRTIVRTLAECGADVAVHYNSDGKSAAALVSELTSAGRKAAAFRCDITSADSVKRMKDEVEKNFGMPDILVVNAVIQYEWKRLLDQDIKDYYSQFESCVMQMVYMAKQFIPYMREQHYGRVIVMNTECAYMAEPGCSAYTSAKRGLDGIVRVLAKEVGADNITVNQIAPGWTITDKERETGINPAPDYVATVPLARRGTDRDIANMAAFLASDLASFTTGAYIPVSGGRVMPAI